MSICSLHRLAVFLLSAGTLFCSCRKQATPQRPPADRTLLVYMCADNNLAQDAQRNLCQLERGVAGLDGTAAGSHLVVYLDTPQGNPRLLEITPAGTREVHTWSSQHDSASSQVMRSVIDRVCREYPAARYGLVLWSHGMAWLPSTATTYFNRVRSHAADAWPATKYFGQDDHPEPTGYLETEELAAALPDGCFDYILFDACFMGSVEVLYALRAKADYIVASPTEVIADGFPYADIIGSLLAPRPGLETVCRTYFEHYANHPDSRYHSASVSLVRTAELDALCDLHARLWHTASALDPTLFAEFDLTKVQRLDRYRQPLLFDLDSIVTRLENTGVITPEQAGDWRQQLARTVLYEAHTPAFFDLPLEVSCGLSGYIPIHAYPDLNAYYFTLAWTACYGDS